ncbi:G/T mismatch-specific thymine DNA glycosylase-like isoform X2 [Chiloscyllium plagiosum]|uniref:G/T mismatch-specific thymine DNA glycosylase-like isoform X2 n=1 Tax=Chiloscyllium plagiosum TaxID=36176 RepID=UPI001CB7F466|nr:G/T mismatch-specific thymine DNA glycosylase-like isoform X2 [Chiloscyllium plagiosum]
MEAQRPLEGSGLSSEYFQNWYGSSDPLAARLWQAQAQAQAATGPDPYSLEEAAAPPKEAGQAPKRKRGRPPGPQKTKTEKNKSEGASSKRGKTGGNTAGKQEKITDAFKVTKRKIDRFNGTTEAELLTKTLPDILTYGLDIVIIGINPGLMAAYKGHHYPGPGNHFWKCLFLSGLIDKPLNHLDDASLPEKYGIGFTNMVERTTPGSKDLKSKEIREGGKILLQKLQKFKPRIAVFNGKCIYEIFSKEVFGVKVKKLEFGQQPHKIPEGETVVYVMPSSSARCAQFPRAQDKVHYYIKLKELRNHLKGIKAPTEVTEVEYSFDLQKAQAEAKKMAIKEEKYDPGYEAAYGGSYIEKSTEINGQCNFATTEPAVTSNSEFNTGSTFCQVPDGQWMTQSFADQIPSINNYCTESQEGNNT